MRHVRTGKVLHTEDFSSLDEDTLIEFFSIKKQIEFNFVNPRFVDKLHLINDIVIPYGYFLKVYVIQKKFRYINLGGQEKMQRKCELTSCVSNQFNGMLTVRALNQDQRRKDYLPVYILLIAFIFLILLN